jgi:hypothetical protein
MQSGTVQDQTKKSVSTRQRHEIGFRLGECGSLMPVRATVFRTSAMASTFADGKSRQVSFS